MPRTCSDPMTPAPIVCYKCAAFTALMFGAILLAVPCALIEIACEIFRVSAPPAPPVDQSGKISLGQPPKGGRPAPPPSSPPAA